MVLSKPHGKCQLTYVTSQLGKNANKYTKLKSAYGHLFFNPNGQYAENIRNAFVLIDIRYDPITHVDRMIGNTVDTCLKYTLVKNV